MRESRGRYHLVFHGRVQNVGFRWTAMHAARELGLTGWVSNLYDGTVEMEVQGSRDRIRDLLGILDSDRYIRITDLEREEIPWLEGETGFRARR